HARDASGAHYWRCFNFAIMAGYNHYRFLFNMRSVQPSGSDMRIRQYLARADFADLYQHVLGRGVFMYDME
ncbi:hypothetical protein NY486_26635, partial [Enterobacter hormaechei]|nr:hypothetical protein [Enterobacter hormaechei]